MHLYQLRLINYRRFVDATINLDSKMVAILGPNESGKSSILDALGLFNSQDRVPASHLRRDSDTSDRRRVAELTYRLTDDERDLIPYELPQSDALWLKFGKHVGGSITVWLDPLPSRPLAARKAAVTALQKAIASPWFRKLVGDEDEDDEDPLTGLLQSLGNELAVEDERLADGVREEARQAVARLSDLDPAGLSETARKAIGGLLGKLTSALEVENHPTPGELAVKLASRRPSAILFDDDHRHLEFTHDLSDVDAVSPAFQNLADFGGLELPALHGAIRANDSGAKRTLLGNAVARINQRLEDEWGQSDLKVDFDIVSLEDVRITVAGADGAQFDLTHRSDGMRMFLALCAFLAKEGQDPKPALLIDELERHLHYEAQADIVSMFDARTDVVQVIYSTHSIGCLPQDLGRGVRTVVADTTAGTSAIDNLWFRGTHGVQPLMAAMGAATLPLQPSRPLVYGEGPCDALLLPSLIREAIGEKPLSFLIVSGASLVSRANVDEFEHAAAHVVYLYDGDQGGRDRRRFLHKHKKVPNERILLLESGVTLEDLIEPGLWVDACNLAIATISNGDYEVREQLTKKDVPSKGRLAALARWCEQRGYRTPEKLKSAETVLELMTGPKPRADRRWLDPRRRDGLRAVHRTITRKLDEAAEA